MEGLSIDDFIFGEDESKAAQDLEIDEDHTFLEKLKQSVDIETAENQAITNDPPQVQYSEPAMVDIMMSAFKNITSGNASDVALKQTLAGILSIGCVSGRFKVTIAQKKVSLPGVVDIRKLRESIKRATNIAANAHPDNDLQLLTDGIAHLLDNLPNSRMFDYKFKGKPVFISHVDIDENDPHNVKIHLSSDRNAFSLDAYRTLYKHEQDLLYANMKTIHKKHVSFTYLPIYTLDGSPVDPYHIAVCFNFGSCPQGTCLCKTSETEYGHINAASFKKIIIYNKDQQFNEKRDAMDKHTGKDPSTVYVRTQAIRGVIRHRSYASVKLFSRKNTLYAPLHITAHCLYKVATNRGRCGPEQISASQLYACYSEMPKIDIERRFAEVQKSTDMSPDEKFQHTVAITKCMNRFIEACYICNIIVPKEEMHHHNNSTQHKRTEQTKNGIKKINMMAKMQRSSHPMKELDMAAIEKGEPEALTEESVMIPLSTLMDLTSGQETCQTGHTSSCELCGAIAIVHLDCCEGSVFKKMCYACSIYQPPCEKAHQRLKCVVCLKDSVDKTTSFGGMACSCTGIIACKACISRDIKKLKQFAEKLIDTVNSIQSIEEEDDFDL